MLRRVIVSMLAGVLVAGAATVAFVPSAYATTSCSTTLHDTTVRGNLVVPPGATCELDHVTVTGSVQVGQGANLQEDSGSSIHGSVQLASNSDFLELPGAAIGGSVTGSSPFYVELDGSVGSVSLTDPVGFFLSGTVSGSVTVTGASGTTPGGLPNGVCGATIGGNLTVQDSTSGSPWVIGDTNPAVTGSCPTGNSIRGSASILSNAASVDFSDNTVGSSLSVSRNTGGGTLDDNQVTGSISCASNNPRYAAAGNTSRGINQAAGGSC